MSLTLPEALKRTRNNLFAGMAKAIVTTDELAAVMPMSPVNSVHDTYRREGTLPGTEYIDDDGITTEESTGEDDNVTVPLRRIVGNLDVDAFAEAKHPRSYKSRDLAKEFEALRDLAFV